MSIKKNSNSLRFSALLACLELNVGKKGFRIVLEKLLASIFDNFKWINGGTCNKKKTDR